jgi:hypothetical protein
MNRKLILVGLLSSAFFVVLAPCAVTNTPWYVDGVNGSDSNNCLSPETACKTIGHAISLASAGDSIIVAAAIYQESLGISISLNVIGSGSSTTIIDGGRVNRVLTIAGSSQFNPHVNISNLTIRNGCCNSGAGIANYGTLTLNKSTVSGNVAFPAQRWPGYGGGIYNSGRLTINDSTITGNRAWCGGYCSGYGGGIYNALIVANLTINNSTVTGNTAGGGLGGGRGGGIYNYGGGVTTDNSTVTGNTSSYRGIGDNIYNYNGGTVALQNSIVANGTNGNCAGIMTSKGYNLSSDNTCNFSGPGDLNSRDPLLGPLQNNGGPTQTMALLPGSPAIDGGNPSGCTDGQGHLLTTDQRGMPRPDKEDSVGCDIGAYESQND